MKKLSIYCILILLSCNSNSNQEPKSDVLYFEGSILWEKKCSLCHSFLTFKSLNQTSLAQMRQLPFETLWSKIEKIKNDSNHMKSPLNINILNDSDLKKITYYIIKTGQPTP